MVSTLISNCEYFRIAEMETLQGNLSLCSLRSCSLLSFSPSSDFLFPASFKDALCPIELPQLNCCVTAVGKRLFKTWLARPLYHLELIREWQDALEVCGWVPHWYAYFLHSIIINSFQGFPIQHMPWTIAKWYCWLWSNFIFRIYVSNFVFRKLSFDVYGFVN